MPQSESSLQGCPWHRSVSFSSQQLANLQYASSVMQGAFRQGRLPGLHEFPPEVMHTLILSWAIANAMLMMLIPKIRRLIWQTLEAIITIVLLIVLILVVLAMPIGVVYLSYQGMMVLGASLLQHFPKLGGVVKRLQQAALYAMGRSNTASS